MLVLRDRIKVKKHHERLAGWKGNIKYMNSVYYFIQLDKTPSITVRLNHEAVEKIEE